MELDEGLIEDLIKMLDSKTPFTLHFPGESFPVSHIGIAKVAAPVTKRTQRGGVYFTDAEIFRIRARVDDKGIVPLISKSMLGPNADFADVMLSATAKIGGKTSKITLHTNLTHSMENASFVDLSLTLIGTELS